MVFPFDFFWNNFLGNAMISVKPSLQIHLRSAYMGSLTFDVNVWTLDIYLQSTFDWNKNCEIGLLYTYFELKFTTGITDIYVVYVHVCMLPCTVGTVGQISEFCWFSAVPESGKWIYFHFLHLLPPAFQFIVYVKFTSKMVGGSSFL